MSIGKIVLVLLACLLLFAVSTTMAAAKPVPKEKMTVTGVTPDYATAGTTSVLTITGTGFKKGAQVEMLHITMIGREQWLQATDEVVDLQGTRIVCSFENIGLTAPSETSEVRVVNPSGKVAWYEGDFTTYMALDIWSVDPATGHWGTTNALTLTGRGFIPGSQVAPQVPGSEQFVEATGETSSNHGTKLAFSVDIPQTASDVQYWNIRVTDPNGAVDWLDDTFYADPPPG